MGVASARLIRSDPRRRRRVHGAPQSRKKKEKENAAAQKKQKRGCRIGAANPRKPRAPQARKKK